MLTHPCPGAQVSQPFGVRWVDYSDWGLSAHNGEDYVGGQWAVAMAPGVVEMIGYDRTGYGVYVTLKHDGFRTRYCHLSVADVAVGEHVSPGQRVGLVGATGHATGEHLHAEFEPAQIVADGLKGRRPFAHLLEGGTVKLGWHLGNEGPVTDTDWAILRAVKPGYVTLLPNYAMHSQPIGRDDALRILDIRGDCHFILRPYLPGTSVATGVAEYANAVDALLTELEGWGVPAGQLHLQIFNEPNMPRWTSQWEGFGDQLSDMQRYNETWLGLVRRFRANHPQWLYGWGPLTIGNRDMWFPGDPEGHYYLHGPVGCRQSMTADQLDEARRTGPCYSSLMEADEYFTHCYLHEGRGNYADPAYGLRHERASLFFPRPLPVIVNEAGYPNVDNWPSWAGDALLDWLDVLYARNTVSGLCLWILGDHWHGMWYDGSGGPREEVWRLQDWQMRHPEQAMTDTEIDGLLGQAMQRYVLPLNADAALAKAGARKGMVPASDEVRQVVGGRTYVVQAFRKSADALRTQHLVRTEEGHWAEEDMHWWTRPN